MKAVLVGFDGSAPVETGAYAFVDDSGELTGDLTGGAIEAQVARDALQGGTRVVTYAISDDQAQQCGLSCGGIAHVLLAPLDDAFTEAERAREARRPHALAHDLQTGATRYVDEATEGGDEVVAAALKLLDRGRDAEERLGDVHIVARVPAPRMFILGAIDIAIAVAEGAQRLGYELTVVEPRPDRTAIDRAPGTISRDDPATVVAAQRLTDRDAVLVFTHDLKLDVPAIQAAFAAGAGYVGALGGRKTTENRNAALKELGVDTSRLHAPCGLDLGAGTPEESALSILAEVLANRKHRDARPLAETKGSIRAR